MVPLLERHWQVEEVAKATRQISRIDLLLLTSATAVDVFAAAAGDKKVGSVAVVGPATAHRCDQLGLKVDVIPSQSTAADLLDELGEIAGLTVLYPRADLAPPTTAEALRRRGATVIDVIAYLNVAPHDYERHLREELPIDITALMSGSTAQRIADVLAPDEFGKLGHIAVIGPSTRKVVQKLGFKVAIMARPHNVAGIVRAVQQLV
ncbi:MAG: uroporphyrinogen-III synthase [Proteobacteria bacterium]|nr:uroporphyrinogen-III synthase [Pseudomonadota bacterium]